VRPALIPPEGVVDWDAVLRFRHFLRHAYVIALDPEKLQTNVARLERAVASTDPWIEAALRAILAT